SKAREIFGPSLDAGRAKRSPDLGPLEVIPATGVCITDNPEPARLITRFGLALYIGGMGSREQNFYNRLVRRYGYEAEAESIQELYLARRRDEAVAAVPDALVDEVAIIGPAAYVKDRLAEFAESGVTTLQASILAPDNPGRIAMLEELIGLI
ncbi:MAG: LLM class flavin-dependent oxidoreductase, partial [Actinomycetota bacterium]